VDGNLEYSKLATEVMPSPRDIEDLLAKHGINFY